MRRKICALGNSYGISIPKEVLEKLHLTPGTQVEVKVDEKEGKIVIEPSIPKTFRETIDRELASQIDDFIERYKPALKALAQK